MRQTLRKLHTRLAAVLAAVLLLVCALPAASAAGGSCGADLTWELTDGRLTISGSGAMTDYDQNNLPPWYDQRGEILWLSLPEGLTSVGTMAFYNCEKLTAVKLPSTVKTVGELAFSQCYGLSSLSLNSGLQSIGRSAFQQCDGLYEARLPDTVTTLGYHAFYRCEGLRYATIPASVTDMGSGVFSYCINLIQAEVYAQIGELPPWTFYGCENLNVLFLSESVKETGENSFTDCTNLSTVSYGGTEAEAAQIKAGIIEDVSFFKMGGTVTAEATGSASAGSAALNADNSLTTTTTSLTTTENATVGASVSTTRQLENGVQTSVGGDVTASIVTDTGWDEMAELIKSVLAQVEKTAKTENLTAETVTATAYVTDASAGVPQNVLTELAGTNVTLTVQEQDRVTLDCSVLEKENVEGTADFSYTISVVDVEESGLSGGLAAYRVQFSGDTTVNAEVMIRLPGGHARQTASLYQRLKKQPELLQAVMVDTEGYAHFYLGNVNSNVEYLVGINVPQPQNNGDAQAAKVDVIVPQVLQADQGITDRIAPVEYVLTGRTSSWGMNLGQVTWIMAGVLFVVVVAVGVTMFLLNKRKLKMGYVPDLDDEDM